MPGVSSCSLTEECVEQTAVKEAWRTMDHEVQWWPSCFLGQGVVNLYT